MQDNSLSEKSVMRLQVYLARCGVASRRSSETYIAGGRVKVNGAVVTEPGTKVSLADTVCVDGLRVTPEAGKRYVLLYKPAGYVCSMSDEKGRETAASLLSPVYKERLYNVGRLDMYSEGLLIFTNDGDFAAAVSHPSAELEKEYLVDTSMPVPSDLPLRFCKGIRIHSVFYRCKDAEIVNPRKVRIVLVEGKNREIRRVFGYFGIGIKRLVRTRIGPIQAGGMSAGQFRDMSETEVKALSEVCRQKKRREE